MNSAANVMLGMNEIQKIATYAGLVSMIDHQVYSAPGEAEASPIQNHRPKQRL